MSKARMFNRASRTKSRNLRQLGTYADAAITVSRVDDFVDCATVEGYANKVSDVFTSLRALVTCIYVCARMHHMGLYANLRAFMAATTIRREVIMFNCILRHSRFAVNCDCRSSNMAALF